MPFTPEQIDDLFSYHAPSPEQQEQYKAIRMAAKNMALAIITNTPPSPDQSVAIRKLREVVSSANASIALKGKY